MDYGCKDRHNFGTMQYKVPSLYKDLCLINYSFGPSSYSAIVHQSYVLYKIVISINNGAKIKNVFLKEKIFGYKLSFFKDSPKNTNINSTSLKSFSKSRESRESQSRLSDSRPTTRYRSESVIIIYIYIYLIINIFTLVRSFSKRIFFVFGKVLIGIVILGIFGISLIGF